MESSLRSDLTVELLDGMVVGYADVGDPDGRPVLFMHGGPTSRLDVTWPGVYEVADRLGMRLLALDRPGMGLSSYRRYAVVDYPKLVAGFADALGLERFGVLGWSSGGKFACACAWALPERVTRAVLISSPASVDMPGVRATWSREVRLLNALGERAPWLLHLLFGGFARDFRRGRLPKMVLSMFEDSAADQAILARPDFRQLFARTLAEGARQGVRGPVQDWILDVRPWDLPLGEVGAPVVIWHGEDDPAESVDQAGILAKALPHVTTHVLPGQGHLLLAGDHVGGILGSALNT